MRPTIPIDPMHNAAIRNEIAERLRVMIKPGTSLLPLRLATLLSRFGEQDREIERLASPSIVPADDEVFAK